MTHIKYTVHHIKRTAVYLRVINATSADLYMKPLKGEVAYQFYKWCTRLYWDTVDNFITTFFYQHHDTSGSTVCVNYESLPKLSHC